MVPDPDHMRHGSDTRLLGRKNDPVHDRVRSGRTCNDLPSVDSDSCNSISGQYNNRLYGAVWLFEQIAIITGLKKDLIDMFDGDLGKVDDILSLAIYSILCTNGYNRMARWMHCYKTSSDCELFSSCITRLF